MTSHPHSQPEGEYPHVRAAFINAIAEEGTKAEAVDWLQKQWNETCALRAELKALRGSGVHTADAWQPIETAPKDKPLLGVWWSDITVGAQPVPHIGICWWAGAWCPHDRKLTHWQPLPDTPSLSSADCEPPLTMSMFLNREDLEAARKERDDMNASPLPSTHRGSES